MEAIESHLRARRGMDHILSPRDFGLARGWHQAGVPLATVLVGMDRAFETGADVTSLAYCRRWVEELAAAGPARRCARRRRRRACPCARWTALLAALLEQLGKHPARARASFDPPLRKIREVQDLLAVASRPNWSYVRAKLREIDDEVSARRPAGALAESERAEFAQEADARHRAPPRPRGRGRPARRHEPLHRCSARASACSLPRVSLIWLASAE